MTGGFLRPALPAAATLHASRCLILPVAAAAALSGCSLLRGPQRAPIIEAVPVFVEPASAALVAAPPETTVPSGPIEPEAPKKPHRPPPPPRRIEPPKPVASPPPAPPPAPAPLVTTRTIGRDDARGLLDAQVQKPDGKVIGRAVNLIADAAGKPVEMVVNLLGFLGVGDRKVSFPWSAFRFTPADHKVPVTLDLVPGRTPPRERTREKEHTATQLPLIDATVERPDGAKVGRVVDVLIDAEAQPQALVLDVSGMVSPDRRMIAANWSALHLVAKGQALQPQIDLSEAQIAASPRYAAGEPVQAVSPAPPAPAAAPATAASAARAVR